nr:ABC transporter ATP-binding protein [uncultured Mogibacterium sp.]
MIRLDNVKVSFKDKVAVDLRCVVEIAEGERVGIIGSNGAGKTTLLKSIIGMVPHKGNISLGVPLNEISVHMQYNSYVDTVSIRNIIEMVMGCKIQDNPSLVEMIDFFEFEECLDKRWKHLSGGQKQRLTLILVMCKDSKIVMFDEVTSGLDFETRQRLMDKLVSWYEKKHTTLLITSHYYTELDNLATKILYLKDGRVVDYGSKEELFRKYCGNAVVIFENTEKGLEIAKDHKQILAAEGFIALSCDNDDEEVEIAEKLIRNHINYRRSNNDIEMMTINAER